MCEELRIINSFSSSAHPQENGQVKVANKITKFNLKKKG